VTWLGNTPAAAAISATLSSAPGRWVHSRAVCSMILYRVERPRSWAIPAGGRSLGSVATPKLYVIQKCR